MNVPCMNEECDSSGRKHVCKTKYVTIVTKILINNEPHNVSDILYPSQCICEEEA